MDEFTSYARVHPLAPVVAIDIDGTLGDYHGHFHWFANMYLQEEYTAFWLDEIKGEFSEALGLDKRVYRDIKLAYRQGGMKRSMPVFDGARECVQEIRESGLQVWITTTRPWNRLDNIDPDTQFWLDRNVEKVDGVVYGEEKYLDLIDIVGKDRIIGVIDDMPDNMISARQLGLRRAMVNGPHNKWFDPAGSIIRINSPREIPAIVRKWREEDAQ